MAAPVWVTGTNLGIAKHLDPCSKTLQATGATSYSLVSGQLPFGLILSPNGVISGTPRVANVIANQQETQFTFTVRASGNGSTDRTFTLGVVYNDLYVPDNFSMSRCRFGPGFLQYQIFRGSVDTGANIIWRIAEGQLPPGTTVNAQGVIEIIPGFDILPFKQEQFIRPEVNVSNYPSLSQDAWNTWLGEYLKTSQDNDYQFRLTLSNGSGPAELSITCRVVILTAPVNSAWFQVNSQYLNINSNQKYIFFAISDVDYIYWNSAADLGTIYNGSQSELDISATCISSKTLTYDIKPETASRLPQQLTLLDNGLIIGRVSFRCYQDDPVNIPPNNDYSFTVRAFTPSRFTYTERTFQLRVIRFHDRPYNNIYVRSFPTADQRRRFNDILNNQGFFPDKFLFRPEDKFFGKARHPRFLLAAGVAPASVENYYNNIIKNHYNKVLLFSEPKSAVSYDSNLRVKYEVVYVPFIDFSQITNFSTNTVYAQPNIIDLRGLIKNFYLKDDQLYYEFEPNGVENMRRIVGAGGYDTGVLPSWMTSIQPVPNIPGQFYNPPGFVACVVLAYTIPGTADAIAYRLRQAGINFNDFKFEFDRYELDDALTQTFDIPTDNFLPSSTQTIFDNGATVFENGATRFNQNLDYSTNLSDRDPDYGTKYLKFPKTGVFV